MLAQRRALLAVALAVAAGRGRAAGGGPAPIAFAELYARETALGRELSPAARALQGRDVRILGYLAPPLKPDIRFFVLTRAPVALCPFCNSDADWPSDIVVVYPRSGGVPAQDGLPVAVAGALDLGSRRDPDSGFVSLVRILDARVDLLR